MSGETEDPHVYQDLEMEETPKTVVENNPQKRWFVPVVVVAVALFGAVCFAAGFAVAYFAVPDAGR